VKQATAQKMGLPEPPTGEREQFCTKCGARVNEWTFLELRGVQVGPDGEVVEIRNCTCRGSLGRLLEGDAARAAVWRALEDHVRAGEALGRELVITSKDGRLVLTSKHRHGVDRVLRGPESLEWGARALLGHF